MTRFNLFPRLFKQINTPLRAQPLQFTAARPSLISSLSITRVPVNRFVHSSPKEYNGLQSATYHFKRQRHMPYFLEYLMWVVFGSEALHLIWLKMDYKEYKEKVQHKTKLLEEIIQRIENGEKIDHSLRDEIRMVLMNHEGEHHDDIDDEYLNKLIASSEQVQADKAETARNKPVVESKWVEVKEDEKTSGQKKKQPFFL